jgi:hypothetical protein
MIRDARRHCRGARVRVRQALVLSREVVMEWTAYEIAALLD